MIKRIISFFQSIGSFFDYINDMLGELVSFVPSYISGALAMLFFFAAVILMVKLVKGLIDVVKSLLASVFSFFL